MAACVHSRLSLRMLFKFGRCLEGSIVCNQGCQVGAQRRYGRPGRRAKSSAFQL